MILVLGGMKFITVHIHPSQRASELDRFTRTLLNPFKHEAHVNNIYKFSFYLKENTSLYYKYQFVMLFREMIARRNYFLDIIHCPNFN
jgi:hypothetical protein